MPTNLKRARGLRPILLPGLILGLAWIGAVAAFLFETRADALDDAASRSRALAAVLAEQVESTIDSFDASLRTIARILMASPSTSLASAVSDAEMTSEFESERRALGVAGLIGVADSAGRVVGGARGGQFSGIDISDRSYFRTLQADPTFRLVISEPLINRATGEWTVFFVRPLVGRDGEFRGVAFIGVRTENLLRASRAIGARAGQSFGLFDKEGRILVRYPAPTRNADIGARIDAPAWRTAIAAGGGSYRSEGYYDGLRKVVAAQPLAHYPLALSVSITDDAALERWRNRSLFVVLGGLIAYALLCGALFAQWRLRRSLSRAQLRSWLRARRLDANQAALVQIRRRFGLTLDYMSHGMAMYDGDGRLIVCNDAYARLYGITPGEIRPGTTVDELVELRIAAGAYCGPSPEAYRLAMQKPFPPERLDHLHNGRIILNRTKMMENGGWVSMQEDVTERIESTERLAHLAMHDRLTGLPNREAFARKLEAIGTHRCGEGRACELVLIDIGGFKSVNDTYGHEVGDRVLVEFASRLRAAAPGAFLARLGGDEFVAFKETTAAAAAPRALGKHLARALRRPFACEGREITVAVSMGCVTVDHESGGVQHALRRADLALAAAKAQGGGRCVLFDPQMERDFEARVGLAAQLRAAIAADELEVHYQPIVDANDGGVVCMEALVRWRHPVNGMVSPGIFIPLAEETGSIGELGEWVMRRACRDAAAWPPRAIVAVNVSSLQFARQNFAESVAEIMSQEGLPPERLQIEITESVLLHNDAQIIEEMNALRDLGVTFALDDFGTGYASLGYLKTFPLDKIKIDKCFVDEICHQPQSIAIVGAVVALARGLAIDVTAEGVETREQFDTLRALGVATMQGYYFGRPRPIGEQSFEAAAVRAA